MAINFTSTTIQPAQKTIFTTDLDGTLLIGAKDNMKRNVQERSYNPTVIQETAQSVKECGIDDVFINTGRNFSELKEVEDVLKNSQLPFSAIALEDGKRLLTKPQNMSGEKWLQELFDKDKNYLRFSDAGWSSKTDTAKQTIKDFLEQELGFIHRKDNNETIIYSKPVSAEDVGVNNISSSAHWEVLLAPAGTSFNLTLRNSTDEDSIDVEKYNKFLSKKIDTLLREKNFDIENATTKKEITYINTYQRGDINKGAVSDYYREMQGDKTLEIRARNDMNDKSMLVSSNPNLVAIQVGNNPKLTQLLANQANSIQVATESLASGIQQAAKKLNLCA